MIGNSTTPRETSFPPQNLFKEVLVCSNLRYAILISSRVYLNNTSIELPVSTSIRSNFLLATMTLMTKASSCGYRIHSSSSSVHMIGTSLTLTRLTGGVLKNTSLVVMAYLAWFFIDLFGSPTNSGPPAITLTIDCSWLKFLLSYSHSHVETTIEKVTSINSSRYRFLTKSST